jgi:hypothetical protein
MLLQQYAAYYALCLGSAHRAQITQPVRLLFLAPRLPYTETCRSAPTDTTHAVGSQKRQRIHVGRIKPRARSTPRHPVSAVTYRRILGSDSRQSVEPSTAYLREPLEAMRGRPSCCVKR